MNMEYEGEYMCVLSMYAMTYLPNMSHKTSLIRFGKTDGVQESP